MAERLKTTASLLSVVKEELNAFAIAPKIKPVRRDAGGSGTLSLGSLTMGVYYHYVNLSKKERFAVDSLGGGIKHSALGRTLAARAFHLLLENATGRWAGDNITVMGDDVTPEWERIEKEFVDIEANAILIVFRQDGFEEIRENAAHDTSLFMQLCHMVTSRQALELEFALDEMSGGKFRTQYSQLCKQRTWFQPKNVVLQDD